MERTLHRNLLKYAVQRQMFHADGTVADVRKSVLIEVTDPVTGGSSMALLAAVTFDNLDLDFPDGFVIEVWDGRELFGGRKGPGYRKLVAGPEPVTVDPDQEVLF